MQPKGTGTILKNAIALLMGQATTSVLSVLVTIYVPRYIGPTGMGELAVASMLTGLVATILSLGMGTIMVRDIARDHRKAAHIVGAAIVIEMLMALPALLILAIITWVAGFSAETRVVVAIASVSMVIAMLTAPFQSGFQAFEHMKYISLGSAISEAIIVFSSVAVVLAGGGVVWLSLVNVVAALVVLFLSVRWWLSIGAVRLHFNLNLMRYLLLKGLPFWASGLFLTIYLYIASLILSLTTNPTVVGWYSVPAGLFGFLLFIPTIVGTAMFPALAHAFKHAPREMVKLSRHSFNLITCISLPIAVGGGLLSKQIILTLYGLAFGQAIPVVTIMSVMVVPMYLNIQVYQILMATGREVAWTKVMAAACVLNPLLNLALIHYYQQYHQNGAFGAAWAMLLTEGLMAVAGIALLPRGILGWSNIISIVKSSAAAGLMALAVWYTRDYFIAIPVVTGGVVYFGAVLVLGVLPREELAMLQMIGAKLLSKVGIKRALSRVDAKPV